MIERDGLTVPVIVTTPFLNLAGVLVAEFWGDGRRLRA